VFLTGAMAGAIGMRAGLHEQLHRNAVYWRGEKAEFSYDQLTRELKLSPEQSQRLKTILDDFVKYHEDLEAQIEDVRATGRNRIVQILTPEQRKRFEQLSEQLPTR
jgi:Spy/CpxP family protein refolding chaperone